MDMGAVKDRILAFLYLYLVHAHFKRVVAFAAVCLHVLYTLELFTVAVLAFVTVTVLLNRAGFTGQNYCRQYYEY